MLSLDETAKEARKQILETVTTSYDKAAAYTNLIVGAGYAGAYATWALTKDQLSREAAALVALLLTISLTTFVLFEIFKMVVTTRANMRVSFLIARELPPHLFLSELGQLKDRDRTAVVKWLMPTWAVALAICVVTALGGVTVLIWNFLAILWDWPLWP